MFWPNNSLGVVLSCVLPVMGMAAEPSTCRDPFYPLYIKDPRNDYEEVLSKQARASQNDSGQVQMVICGESPMVVLSGKLYKLGDSLMNGIIVEITCDHLVTRGDNTQTVINFVEKGLIEKRAPRSE